MVVEATDATLCSIDDECPGGFSSQPVFGCGGSRGRFRVYPVVMTKATDFVFTANLTVIKNGLSLSLF